MAEFWNVTSSKDEECYACMRKIVCGDKFYYFPELGLMACLRCIAEFAHRNENPIKGKSVM
jgi:hypothetical protein